MKNRFLLLSLLLLPLFMKAQNSFPLYAQNPTWRIIHTFWTSSQAEVIAYLSDTLYEGRTYSKISDYGTYLVRNEGKKTWIRVKDYNRTTYSREFLLYDFAMQIGDSAKVGPSNWANRVDSTMRIKVEAIDSILVGSTWRKRLTVYYQPCSATLPLTRRMYWIEGVGASIHPFYSTQCLCDNCEQSFNLICLKLNNTPFYLSNGYPNCDYVPVGTDDIPNAEFTISPNPFTQHLVLKGAENIEKIQLYSTDGVYVRTVSMSELANTNFGNLAEGVYLLMAFDKLGVKLGTQKIVKMRQP